MVKEYVVSNSEGILDFNGNKLATWRVTNFLIVKYHRGDNDEREYTEA